MADLDVFEPRFAEAYRRYLDEAPTAIDAAAVARSVAVAHQPTRLRLVWPWASRPIPALAWLVLIAAVLAALGTALIGSRLLQAVPEPPHLGARLAPTGIDVLAPDAGAYARIVADGNGIVWGLEREGRLVRLDPATGSAQTWTVNDDAAFAAYDIAPAKAGGVWLISGHELRWFDGAVFREVIEAPEELGHVAEAPDATLWVATGRRVLHWNGSRWNTFDPLAAAGSMFRIDAIAVDAAGHPWIGWSKFFDFGGVSRFDGSSWTTFGRNDAAPLGEVVSGFAQLPDGTVWVATRGGVSRFDGTSWTNQALQPSAGSSTSWSVAAGLDGTLWVAAAAQDVGPFTVGRFDGNTWVAHGPAGGLQAPADDRGTASLVPAKQGMYVGTGAGIYRLANDRWERVWPPAASPTNVTILLTVSHDELWAGGDGGLWHLQAGAWTHEPIDTDDPLSAPVAMALAPDGTVWAAGEAGVAYRRDGRWTIADPTAASAIAIDDAGPVWVAGAAGVAGTVGQAPAPVWALRSDGRRWAKGAIEMCPFYAEQQVSLAVDGTGVLWVGARNTLANVANGGVARFDGRSWTTIADLGGAATDAAAVLGTDGATVLGTGAEGTIWIMTESQFARVLRFDGMAWTSVDVPEDRVGGAFTTAGGTLWVPTERGLARYDGRRWTFPYVDDFSPSNTFVGAYAIARDGTVFGQTATGIVRFPVLVPRP